MTTSDSGTVDAELEDLANRARESLEANLHEIGDRTYLSAGHFQFRSLWTRDFCFSVPGLLRIGRPEIVRHQLELLLANLGDADPALDAVPRTFDSRSPSVRVAWGASLRRRLSIGEPLRAQLLDQYGRVAIDGNALVVIATRNYVVATGDEEFWSRHRTQLQRALRFYTAYKGANGLIIQHAFADWRDSLERRGATFYTNLLYVTALVAVSHDSSFGVTPEIIATYRTLIEDTFHDAETGLYRSQHGASSIALDCNLLAIELEYTRDASALYGSLRRHPLWTDPCGPGFVTNSEFSVWTKAPQVWPMLRDYHTSLYWSWLMALSAKTAVRVGDDESASTILAELLRMARRDGHIAEVYTHSPEHEMVWRTLYKSEAPFSWGAAMAVDAVGYAQER